MKTMQRDQNESSPKERYPSSHVGTARLRSDVVVAAVCYQTPRNILDEGSRKILDSNTMCLRVPHYGSKPLLDIAQGSMTLLGELRVFDPNFMAPHRKLSKARRATFWSIARQDYLAAYKFAALTIGLQK